MSQRWYYIELRCQGVPAGEIEDSIETMMDALVDEPGDVDADLSADPVAGTVVFHVSVEAHEAGEALSRAQTFVRSALHSAGVATPGWEELTDLVDRGEAVATVRLSGAPDSLPA